MIDAAVGSNTSGWIVLPKYQATKHKLVTKPARVIEGLKPVMNTKEKVSKNPTSTLEYFEIFEKIRRENLTKIVRL